MKKNGTTAVQRLRGRPQGFSLVGTMIGTLIVGVVTVGGSMLYADYKQDQVARGRGKQLGNGLAQLDNFARKYQPQLTAGQAIAGVANASAPTTAELQGLGFAAPGFSDASQPGGPIAFQIAREPAGCAAAKCILSLKAVTSGSVQVKGMADAPFAQRIAGYVPNGAGWSNLASDGTRLGKNGLTIPNPLGGTPAIVAAVAWLGNNQASQTVPPVTYNYRSLSCGSGYTGTYDQQQSVITDKYGNTTTGAWTTYADNCTAIPPPPPPPPPTCANGAADYPTCTPPLPPSCANGAADYPTCTSPPPPLPPPPPPPPPPKVCAFRVTFSCTASGRIPSSGLYKETDWIDDGTGTGTCTNETFQVGTCGHSVAGYWYTLW